MQYPARYPAKYSALVRYSTRLCRIGILLALLPLAGCQNHEFEKSDGTVLQWESLRGHWVLVNYWAEWCKPCLEEIPELNSIDTASAVVVLGVNFGLQFGFFCTWLCSYLDYLWQSMKVFWNLIEYFNYL